MGQSKPFKPMALVVEDDETQRDVIAMLLEECEMGVIQCDSAEAALQVLDRVGPLLTMLYTDVSLAGDVDGIELARVARQEHPQIHVIVASGYPLKNDLPEQALFMPKPFLPLDLLREAERARTEGAH
ncbi:MAG: response regulator [Pseudolabrys sp.]|nr:response regulator [Pseudolabrys sp.]